MPSIEQLATTLQGLANPEIKRKELVAAVRKRHPDASKKDIVRAAFYALTSPVDGDLERAHRLHDFALRERADQDGAAPIRVTRRKKGKRSDAEQDHKQAH